MDCTTMSPESLSKPSNVYLILVRKSAVSESVVSAETTTSTILLYICLVAI
jgi:hypothetical protein